MPAPEALSLEIHERILDAAGDLFEACGFEGASMSAITRRSGVSKGTIYHHFESKAGLFGAYVRRECRRSLKPIFDTIEDEIDERTTLLDIGQRMLTLLVSPMGLAIDRVVVSEAERFPELAAAFYAAGPGAAIEAMARWLSSRTESGALCVDDPVFAAEQFFALCQTQAVMKRKLRLTNALPAQIVDKIVTGAVDTFMKAYASKTKSPSQITE